MPSTYVRMTGGRDRGHVLDMRNEEAEAMLKDGRAVPVDFSEPNPLGFREIEDPQVKAKEKTQPQAPAGEVPIMAGAEPAAPVQSAQEPPAKAPGSRFKRR